MYNHPLPISKFFEFNRILVSTNGALSRYTLLYRLMQSFKQEIPCAMFFRHRATRSVTSCNDIRDVETHGGKKTGRAGRATCIELEPEGKVNAI